jgi:hypothetical protein
MFSIEFDSWSIKVGFKKKAEGLKESGDMSTGISFSTLSPFFEFKQVFINLRQIN